MIIAAANINDIEIDLTHISNERLERVDKLHFEEDRKRSLCAEFLLNHILHMMDESIRFPLNLGILKDGKPYLPDYPQYHFNLSHSGAYAVCAVDLLPVGVDIEVIRPISDQIARRFFTRKEYLDIHKCSESEEGRLDLFYQYWVLKESFMKTLGLGMQLPMDSFEILMQEDMISYCQSITNGQYFGKIFNEIEGYKIGVCSEHKDIKETELVMVTSGK
ncbi:MAG: 4'-phosphopantetheinyl transferase superfamily protein [Clostridia bacterium]|nr:4'-phosphopantetheinyl transferase superfamily protein [Clostridia bacterium]